MDIPLQAEVRCADGADGRTTRVVVDPQRRVVTHVVVRLAGLIGLEVLVPVDVIVESAPQYVRLRLTKAELERMPSFEETDYLWPPDADERLLGQFSLGYPVESMAIWPYEPLPPALVTTHEAIPPGEVALRRGALVEASDGVAGRIDELLADPVSGVITHLVLREGHIWGRKEVTIPVGEVASITEDRVCLRLSRAQVERLPAIPLSRRAASAEA